MFTGKTTEGCADKKVVWSKQVKWELVESGAIWSDFVGKLEWKWGVWFGNGNNSCIA